MTALPHLIQEKAVEKQQIKFAWPYVVLSLLICGGISQFNQQMKHPEVPLRMLKTCSQNISKKRKFNRRERLLLQEFDRKMFKKRLS